MIKFGQAMPLNIQMKPTGHWHFNGGAKKLIFTITDFKNNPITGLKPTITVKTLSGSADTIEDVFYNMDGTYSAEYIALDMGTGYSTGYSICINFAYRGADYFNHWPVDVVRDGNESILPTVGGVLYSYQVRYAWNPNRIEPGQEITMYFENRRAIQTGDKLNIVKPWLNATDYLTDLKNVSALVETADGKPISNLTPEYAGLGVYKAKYTPDSRGEYRVYFLFTDPCNGYTIEKEKTAYPLFVGVRTDLHHGGGHHHDGETHHEH